MIPSATYRLQFNRDFTFADATRIIPYLQQLGVSHIYASPYLKARAGSQHGYDIVDHNRLNPEIGDAAAYTEFVATLRQHGMGQILDIVPNHMGVGGDDNHWWLDVLEHGEASYFADYFDIDWHPVKAALNNKILLPFLGDHYGTVLEAGEFRLGLERERGAFSVRYYDHLLPLDPRTWPQILTPLADEITASATASTALAELRTLINACQALPRRTDLSAPQRRRRHSGSAACKQRLLQLLEIHAELNDPLQRILDQFNGDLQQPHSFDRLHRLLESQAYRPAYWQVALDEINYRRFFDINDLAGLRMDNPEVFSAAHRLIRQLVTEHQVDGLRIDHPDGLYDPQSYCHDLQRLIAASDDHIHLWVEKILAGHEQLPPGWPVAGTTGYESAFLLNGVFIRPDGEARLTRLYRRFTRQSTDFNDLLYNCKKLIIQRTLASELSVLANLLNSIAQSDRHTRDFTLLGLRDALSEVAACFPVYRTYVTAQRSSDADHHHIKWAIVQAKRRNPATDKLIFDFIHQLLLPERLPRQPTHLRRKQTQFILRFQQFTAPVTAKALEDTTFYRYNRLVSLNDVGFNPQTFGTTTAEFHKQNQHRLNHWPAALVNTSTHDSKRSEDVRCRINVLSEVAVEWHHRVLRWREINRHHKRLLEDETAPSPNDEYLLYQTLIGAWPLTPLGPDTLADLCQRIDVYMTKAVREAKIHSAWISPNEAYEEALHHFIHNLLDGNDENEFIRDFLPFQRRIARLGLYNSLSQTALKLTMPGIPDIYQGNELFTFNLVDPDNRRPVDHDTHHERLHALEQQDQNSLQPGTLACELLEHIEDGRAKLYLTWKALNLRRRQPDLFHKGDYLPLAVAGQRRDHICAFARRLDDNEIIVATARWFAALTEGREQQLPIHAPAWSETWVEAPPEAQPRYRNLLTNERIGTEPHQQGRWFAAAELFRNFPVALLVADAQ